MQAELKSLQAMYALPESEGCADQHWHRDTGLPFEDDRHFHLTGVHARAGGAQILTRPKGKHTAEGAARRGGRGGGGGGGGEGGAILPSYAFNVSLQG
jgi:hypothetical protein